MIMKSNTSMTIRMNSEVKKKAQTLFLNLGMDMTTAINVFLLQAIRKNGFPFEIVLEKPNEVTIEAIKEADEGVHLHGPFESVEELMEDLNA